MLPPCMILLLNEELKLSKLTTMEFKSIFNQTFTWKNKIYHYNDDTT